MKQIKLQREKIYDNKVNLISERIRIQLKNKKMTQQNLADITTIPYDRIKSYMRSNATNIPTSALYNIADALNVSIDYLCGRTENPFVSFDNDIELMLNSVCYLVASKYKNAFNIDVRRERVLISALHPVIKGLMLNVIANPNISDGKINELVRLVSKDLTEYKGWILTNKQYMETIHSEYVMQVPMEIEEAMEADVLEYYYDRIDELEMEWMNLTDEEKIKWSRLSEDEKRRLYSLSVSEKKANLK